MYAPGLLTPLLLTLKVAGLATLIAFVLGTASGRLFSRRESVVAAVLDSLASLPMVLPPTVIGYYLMVFIGKNGPIGALLRDWFGVNLIFTWQGAVVATAVVSFPLVHRSARAAFEGVDKNLENAARCLGAREIEVFLRVSLPLAWKGLLAGTMLAFARGMGEFGATLMVAGNLPGRTQTLSLAVYDAVQAGNDDLARFLVAVTSIVCMSVLVASNRLLDRNR